MRTEVSWRWRVGALLGVMAACGLAACGRHSSQGNNAPRGPAGPAVDHYTAEVTAFFTGVAALDISENTLARDRLTQAVALAPDEPAAWADLGLADIRNTDIAGARIALFRAHALAPNVGRIVWMMGLLAEQQGKPKQMLADDRKAVDLDPSDLVERYFLYRKLSDLPTGPGLEGQAQLEAILKQQPDNLAALTAMARLGAMRGDSVLVRQELGRLQSLSAGWSAQAKGYLVAAEKATGQRRVTSTTILKKILILNPAFDADLNRLGVPSALNGAPIEQFIKLKNPSPKAAPPDTALVFTSQAAGEKCDWARSMPLGKDGAPLLVRSAGKNLFIDAVKPAVLTFPLGSPKGAPDRGALALDWNNDRNMDIALAGPCGLKLYQGSAALSWTDVTARSGLPTSVLKGSYSCAWSLDLDYDGCLDILLGASAGLPTVLLNNGDGTWKVTHPFSGLSGVTAFAWVDLFGDGAAEAAIADGAGALHIFRYDRIGHYNAVVLPALDGKVLDLTVADLGRSGLLDLVVLLQGGEIVRVFRALPGVGLKAAPVVTWKGAPADGSGRVFVADLDNNCAMDLIASGGRGTAIWLGDSGGNFSPLAEAPAARVFSVADLDGDGRLDLVGVDAGGQPIRLINHGARNYGWQEIHCRTGDSRNNTFAIGGQITVRSGLLVEKQPILEPVVHFGLGEGMMINVAQFIWPNGATQDEFDLKPDTGGEVSQRLMSSCPWLFAWNGHSLQFVTDVLWKSPLGLRINAQDTAGVSQTRDWVIVRGDQLAPCHGYYDLRITAELWETHFFDYVALMAVDHPADMNVFVDERFSIPQPPLKVWSTGPVIPVAHAWDESGRDVTSIVRANDGRYLDTFGRGAYQGITRDHYVEVEAGSDVPTQGRLFLVAEGWIHPTDSSINVAISHGHHPVPQGLSLEALDSSGKWKTARSGLGFPAGKNKTVLIDVTGLFRTGMPRRLRLRTNLEIFWDSIGFARALPDGSLHTRLIAPSSAMLRYRGFSAVNQLAWSSPELPDYNHIWATSPQWLDLTGYYTRFGDVRELLRTVDDRYVIMNAGDEMALRFPQAPPPRPGWVRDFVFESDGWEKDGNLNTTDSGTVLPLPSHRRPAYNTPPGPLQDDPVYRQHRADWRIYQTRYVTPDGFREQLWRKRGD